MEKSLFSTLTVFNDLLLATKNITKAMPFLGGFGVVSAAHGQKERPFTREAGGVVLGWMDS